MGHIFGLYSDQSKATAEPAPSVDQGGVVSALLRGPAESPGRAHGIPSPALGTGTPGSPGCVCCPLDVVCTAPGVGGALPCPTD